MEKIKEGQGPLRPPESTGLGPSDEIWVVIQSSLVREVEKRPPASAFVEWFEAANPSTAVLKELTKFDANSEDDIQKLRRMLGYGDNTLLGMREEESLVVIEVFDQVDLIMSRLSPVLTPNVPGPQLLIERPHAPQPVPAWTSEGLRPVWSSAEELLDLQL